MPITRRVRGRAVSIDGETHEEQQTTRKNGLIGIVHYAIAIVFLVFVGHVTWSQPSYSSQRRSSELPTSAETDRYHLVERNLVADGVTLEMKLELSLPAMTEAHDGISTAAVAVGTNNNVKVSISDQDCPVPRLWMRLVGASLVSVELFEDIESGQWTGTFQAPVPGYYDIEARWYVCRGGKTWIPLPIDVAFEALGSTSALIPDVTSMFPSSGWVDMKYTKSLDSTVRLPNYMWNMTNAPSSPLNNLRDNHLSNLIQLRDTAVFKDAAAGNPGGFHAFSDLGNYELVCFCGSKTMSDIREKFLELRPQLFPNQRPFKFHYYDITDFANPDRGWTLDTKKRIRKCKQMLVLVDETHRRLSREEYEEEFVVFIRHLLMLMNDKTFPIWILTDMKPPMLESNCHSPTFRRTSGNPCNDILKRLFQEKSGMFPDRVHLVDNTDICDPQFDENRDDILAAVALRVFVFVGKQVKWWRNTGQRGMIDGLHRNATVQPNFELIPYTGWSSTSS